MSIFEKMKQRRKYIALLLVLGLGVLLYGLFLNVFNQKKERSNAPKASKEKFHLEEKVMSGEKSDVEPEFKASANGHFLLDRLSKVSFAIDGNLDETGYYWKTGDAFQKGDLLFMLNNEVLYSEISAKKAKLRERLLKLSDELEEVNKNGVVVWRSYASKISETDLLPPSDFTKENQPYLHTEKVLEDIHSIELMEKNLFSYFYLAPYNGNVAWVAKNQQKGRNVKSGEVVALLSKKKSLQFQVIVDENTLESSNESTIAILTQNEKTLTVKLSKPQFKRQSANSILTFQVPVSSLNGIDVRKSCQFILK